MRVRFSPLAPEQKRKNVYVLYFFNCPYEKDHVMGLLAPGCKKKSIYALIFYDRPYEKDYAVGLLMQATLNRKNINTLSL